MKERGEGEGQEEGQEEEGGACYRYPLLLWEGGDARYRCLLLGCEMGMGNGGSVLGSRKRSRRSIFSDLFSILYRP